MFLGCLTQLSCITIRIELDTTGGDQSMKSARHDGRGISAKEDTTVRDQSTNSARHDGGEGKYKER